LTLSIDKSRGFTTRPINEKIYSQTLKSLAVDVKKYDSFKKGYVYLI